jgi:hypothetical protein
MKKLSVKDWITNIISESDVQSGAPNISPDNVDFVSNIVFKLQKGSVVIYFVTKDKRLLQLTTKDTTFYKWIKEKSENEENVPVEFVTWFLKNSKPREDKMLSEIVDDYNNLIGDDDLPKDIDNRMIGLSSTDSDTAVYQMRAKPMKNYASWGLGFVTW